MGALDNSVFQGSLLISDSLIRRYFPSSGETKVMLVDGPFQKRQEIGKRLEELFRDQGMMVTPTSVKLAGFNSVQNTYLSVFMLLGGLGILIGTIGMGFFLIRNIVERKKELAVYLALGFTPSQLLKLLCTEYLIIFLSGICIGIISAITALIPSLLSLDFQLPAVFLLLIIACILFSGVAWIFFPVKSTLKENLVLSLREE
ncbi:MAG: FtsX-like permease family protein [Bacteroidetes bacterium]|nr:FtsX-like permease family protein [Bacteroidota bacterium]